MSLPITLQVLTARVFSIHESHFPYWKILTNKEVFQDFLLWRNKRVEILSSIYVKFCHLTGCKKPGLKGSIWNNYWCLLVWNPVFWTDDSSTENTNITWAVNHYSVYSEFSCLNGQCIVLFHLNIKGFHKFWDSSSSKCLTQNIHRH